MVTTLDKALTGQRLRRLRGDRTQKEVGDAVGVSAMAICQYETGERSPSDSVKIKLADYFGQTVEAIFFTF